MWRVLPGDIPDRSVQDVRAALMARREVALLDVREEAPFAEAHPLFAANMPYSVIETHAARRLPRHDVPIVVYDDGEGLARRAAQRLRALGYVDVCLLAGGLAGWRRAGGELFRDVNVPSKSFGELVESQRHTPSLSAEAVQALIDARADVVVLDARRFDEYNTMSIPGGISVPGAELALRIKDLAPDPRTQVIVNCAGRTRSIIGTQSLVNIGIPNPVAALRNGTIGWTLAGQTLERGQSRRHAGSVADAWRTDARTRARRLADRAGVARVSLAQALQQPADRTCYWLDVRTPEEYARSHLPGFASAPGGQLVQETDHVAAVRGARIVLVDDDGVRANMTASWLAQMGWDVHVVDDAPPVTEWPAAEPAAAGLRAVDVPEDRWVDGAALAGWLDDPTVAPALRIVDMGASADYRKQHVPGASHVRRADAQALAKVLASTPGITRVVLTSPDGALAAHGWSDVAEMLRVWGIAATVYVLRDGSQGWTAAGERLTAEAPDWVVEPTDRYRRPYEGTDNPVAAMQGYLDWEYGLVDQLARDGTHGFTVLAAE
ncbi:rhodanese-like domain-containing protein [Alcaligenaceae bacterium C4P045]|nr:rhodanese-like domain-containing protein [Alcaligenaceae bacterium C4P045]